MKFNTALSFVCVGFSLFVLVSPSPGQGMRRFAQACLLVPLVLSFLNIVQYCLGRDLGVDQLIFRDVTKVFPHLPGRMALATAICFVLASAGILILNSKRYILVLQAMALLIVVLASGMLLAYLYSVESVFSGYWIPMAVHTAAAFLFLGSGILLARPALGVMRIFCDEATPGFLVRRFFIPAMGIPVGIGCVMLWGHNAGLYELAFELALMVLFCMCVMGATVWWNANLLLRTDEIRRRVEEALLAEKAEGKFRVVAQTIGDAIVSADDRGNIVYFNPGAQRIFGYAGEEVLGRPLTILMPSSFQEIHRQAFARFRSTGKPRIIGKTVEFSGRRKNGTVFPVELSLGTYPSGERIYFTAILRDISAHKWMVALLKAQVEIGKIYYEPLSQVEALQKISHTIAVFLGWEIGCVWEVDAGANCLRYSASWCSPSAEVPEFEKITRQITFPPGVGLPGRIWASREPAWICDVTVDDNFSCAPYARKDNIRGAFGFPILQGGKVFGVMEFFSRKIQESSPDVLGVLSPLGGQIGQFLERRQVQEMLAVRTDLALLGVEIGFFLTQPDDLRKMLKRCSEAILRHLDAAFVRIWTFDEDQKVLELQASAGMYTHLDGAHSRVPLGHLKIGLIAQEKKPHVTNQVIGDPRVGDQEWAKREGMVAFAGHPLLIGDRLIGVVALFARHPLPQTVLSSMIPVSEEIALGIERKRQEGELRQLAAIVEAFRDAIIGMTPDGFITDWNHAAEEIYGYNAIEVLGRSISFLYPADRLGELEGILQRARRGEAMQDYQTERVRKGGQRIYVSLTISPIKEASGKVVAVVCSARDITARRREAEDLNNLRDALERSMEESARKLCETVQNRQVDDAKDIPGTADLMNLVTELARSNKELEQFAATASYCLKDPLRKISNCTQLLEQRYKGNLDSKADTTIQHIVDGAASMRALIDDLRIYSQIGRGPCLEEQVDVAGVLETIAREKESQIKACGGSLTHDPLPAIQADPRDVRRLLESLLSNTIKFHSGEPPRVHVFAQKMEGGWRFGVRDNGIGIAPKFHKEIFQPFARLHPASQYTGGGMGLAICKGIVEGWGGSIWVESKPGEGSTFWFTVSEKGKSLAPCHL